MKAIKCIETGVIYKSLHAATQALGKTGIDKAANGVTSKCGGYHWEWCGTDEVEMKKSPSKAELERAKELIDRAYSEKFNPAWGMTFATRDGGRL